MKSYIMGRKRLDEKKEDSDILNLQLTTQEQGGVLCDFHGDPVEWVPIWVLKGSELVDVWLCTGIWDNSI